MIKDGRLKNENDVSLIFKNFDSNKDQNLHFKEFAHFLMQKNPTNTRDLLRIFDFIDIDKDGIVTYEEFSA